MMNIQVSNVNARLSKWKRFLITILFVSFVFSNLKESFIFNVLEQLQFDLRLLQHSSDVTLILQEMLHYLYW